MLKSSKTTYEISLAELKAIIARELGCQPDKLEVTDITKDVGDDRFGPTSTVFNGLRVVQTH